MICICSMVAISVAHLSASAGVKAALTQSLLDYARDVAKPVLIDFVQGYPIPNPLFKNDSYSFTWQVGAVALTNTPNAAIDVSLESPTALRVSISDLQLGLKGQAFAREDFWPNPTLSVNVSADMDGSSASATLAFDVSAGVPSVSLNACNANINVNNVNCDWWWPFNQLCPLLVSTFHDEISAWGKEMLCSQIMSTQLVSTFMNPFLRSFNYQGVLPFPAPFENVTVDYHLTAAPIVVPGWNPPYSTYLEAAATGRLFWAGGPLPPFPLPTMPALSSVQLTNHMATAQLHPFVFNTGLWAVWHRGLLQYGPIASTSLPKPERACLNTAFYKLLLPSMYKAYPNQRMNLLLSAADRPVVAITASAITLRFPAKIFWSIEATRANQSGTQIGIGPGRAAGSIPAFSLSCPLKASIGLGVGSTATGEPKLTGEVHNVNLACHANSSSFGTLGPQLIAALTDPANAAVNNILLPIVNRVLQAGFPIKPIDQVLGGYRLMLRPISPAIHLADGFAYLGTDARVTLTPA